MDVKSSLIQWGFKPKPRLNEVKPPADALRFFRGSLSSELDKNPGANSMGRI